jgi:hypothetical protein
VVAYSCSAPSRPRGGPRVRWAWAAGGGAGGAVGVGGAGDAGGDVAIAVGAGGAGLAGGRGALHKEGPAAAAQRSASGGAVAEGPRATGGGAGERKDWGASVAAEVVDGLNFCGG